MLPASMSSDLTGNIGWAALVAIQSFSNAFAKTATVLNQIKSTLFIESFHAAQSALHRKDKPFLQSRHIIII